MLSDMIHELTTQADEEKARADAFLTEADNAREALAQAEEGSIGWALADRKLTHADTANQTASLIESKIREAISALEEVEREREFWAPAKA